MREKNGMSGSVYGMLAIFGLLVAGCASNGTLATQKLAVGERAIMDAREGNASLNAAADLNAAEAHLLEAKEALAKKEYEKAARWAERAFIDAEYARTKAATEKAKRNAEEMRKNIESLRQEIERLSQK